MRWEIWIVFVITETALCLTPGPAVPFVLSQALARGTLSSIWSNVGILAGNTIYFILSATGLGAMVFFSALLPQFVDPAQGMARQVASSRSPASVSSFACSPPTELWPGA
jgi:threonine/homoserine/homoserine lactone efflux protein